MKAYRPWLLASCSVVVVAAVWVVLRCGVFFDAGDYVVTAMYRTPPTPRWNRVMAARFHPGNHVCARYLDPETAAISDAEVQQISDALVRMRGMYHTSAMRETFFSAARVWSAQWDDSLHTRSAAEEWLEEQVSAASVEDRLGLLLHHARALSAAREALGATREVLGDVPPIRPYSLVQLKTQRAELVTQLEKLWEGHRSAFTVPSTQARVERAVTETLRRLELGRTD